jgi:hypothetical protein
MVKPGSKRKAKQDTLPYHPQPGERELIRKLGKRVGISTASGVLRHALVKLAKEEGLQ